MFWRESEDKMIRYEVAGGFLIDIIETKDQFEAWISLKGYGKKEHMFGGRKESETLESFSEIVYGNIPRYASIFVEELLCNELALEFDTE